MITFIKMILKYTVEFENNQNSCLNSIINLLSDSHIETKNGLF